MPCCPEMELLLRELVKTLPKQGDIPRIPGLDIAGGIISHNGKIGGDHITFIDFNKRYDLDARIAQATDSQVRKNLAKNKKRAGILIADVSGHDITTAVIAGQLHQAFLLGVRYELEMYGEITARLFEELNQRFCNTSARGDMKFITLLYGEISQNGTFRFISAGHEYPKIFSYKRDCFVDIQTNEISSTQPIGILPSRGDVDDRDVNNLIGYQDEIVINERRMLAVGDMIILYTDGLEILVNKQSKLYYPDRLELILQRAKDLPAQDIYKRLRRDIRNFGPLQDDVSVILIKRT